MTQSVELLLDARSEAALVAEWTSLEAAGLASQARHAGASNRPHVTLTASRAVPETAEDALARACSERLPLEGRLGALAVFGADPVVLVRLVVVTRALLDLHEQVADLVGLPPDTLVSPGRWTPHVTLARRMPRAQLPAALEALEPGPGEHVQFVDARRWDSEARRDWSLVAGPDPR